MIPLVPDVSTAICPIACNPAEAQNPWQLLGCIAFNNLVQEYENGFANTTHVMSFPREVFSVEKDKQEGDVFQRALLLDTLLDFDACMEHRLQQLIQKEAEYLINVRRKTGIGGWSYFPGLPQLPPDADDLAQVMQVLLRAGYRHMSDTLFEEPLRVLLNEQQNDTAWETWIIPKQNKSPEQQLQTQWVQKAWGTGSDIEVVANLVYALILYDRERFAAAIDRGICFLAGSHQQRFRWNSTWYYGEHYGTYVAVRALCAAGADNSLIEKIMYGIERCRQADGSWAVEGQGSSPLQTAIALLTLSTGHTFLGRKLNIASLQSSLCYLQQTMMADQSWKATPFIQMPMGRPYGEIHTILTYQSTAITSNYIAKACHHISGQHLSGQRE